MTFFERLLLIAIFLFPTPRAMADSTFQHLAFARLGQSDDSLHIKVSQAGRIEIIIDKTLYTTSAQGTYQNYSQISNPDDEKQSTIFFDPDLSVVETPILSLCPPTSIAPNFFYYRIDRPNIFIKIRNLPKDQGKIRVETYDRSKPSAPATTEFWEPTIPANKSKKGKPRLPYFRVWQSSLEVKDGIEIINQRHRIGSAHGLRSMLPLFLERGHDNLLPDLVTLEIFWTRPPKTGLDMSVSLLPNPQLYPQFRFSPLLTAGQTVVTLGQELDWQSYPVIATVTKTSTPKQEEELFDYLPGYPWFTYLRQVRANPEHLGILGHVTMVQAQYNIEFVAFKNWASAEHALKRNFEALGELPDLVSRDSVIPLIATRSELFLKGITRGQGFNMGFDCFNRLRGINLIY